VSCGGDAVLIGDVKKGRASVREALARIRCYPTSKLMQGTTAQHSTGLSKSVNPTIKIIALALVPIR
jgi:hypothetical protein